MHNFVTNACIKVKFSGGGGGGDSVLAAVSVKHSPERNDVMYMKVL